MVPRDLVKGSAGFIMRGIWLRTMSHCAFHSCMAKCWSLFDVHTAKQRKNAFIAKVNAIFRADGGDKVVDGNNISTANSSQIFNLAVAFKDASVEAAFMRGDSETMTSNYKVDKE